VMLAVLLARRPDLRQGMVPATVLFLLALLAGARLAPCLPASGADLDALLAELSPAQRPHAPAASSQRTI